MPASSKPHDQTPSLPGPGPANGATREKQIPFRFLSDRYMKPFLVALAVVLSVRLANAATITITSGEFTFSEPVAGFSAASGRLIGAGFDLDGGVRNSNPDCGFGGCSGGFSYLIDASLGNELARGNVRIGNGPPDVFASFNQIESFRFTGPSIDIPHTAAPSITLTGPFSFIGRIPITLFTHPDPPVTVTFELLGSGTFTLSLDQTAPDKFLVRSERFDFEAVPEPGSLLLLGSGLAFWGVRLRR